MKVKSKLLITLIAVLLCAVMAVFITACNNGSGGNKQGRVPVYQGMSLSEATSATATKMSSALSTETDSSAPNYSGDYSGREDDIDKDNPFDNDGVAPSESIEEAIESTLKVTGSVEPIYYATPNEDIFITIHIDNPDNYEIMSFTLNGEKYSSYMFEYGSDMENLILKKNVGNVSGIIEYTIDEIKYIDGTEIKDVLIDGDQTVLAGIRTANQVEAHVTESISFNKIGLSVTVQDRDGLLEYSSGKLLAVLYDGELLIDQAELNVGSNTVEFDGLKTGGLYQYAIVGYYDSLIDGFKMNVLRKNAFFTENIVLFNNIQVTNGGISFGYTWHKDSTVKEMTSLTLLKNGEETALSADQTSVNGLLSNNDYTLVARYQNDGKQEEIKLDFHTLAKATPDIAVTTSNATQTGFDFDISVTDDDHVGSITKIERIHNGQTTNAELAARTFTDLLSDNEYKVRVTYTYNLNDGTNEHTIVKEATATTLAKATPEIEVVAADITKTEISFDISENDIDGVGEVVKIELFNGDTVAYSTEDTTERAFTDLQPYTLYTIKVTYKYDLNDGVGDIYTTAEKALYTLPEFEAVGTECINTRPVSEGENIVLNINVTNPSAATVCEVKVNGLWYAADNTTTATNIRVQIESKGQFAGGETLLAVEAVKATLGGKDFTFTLTANNTATCFVNGNIEVVGISVVDESGNKLEYAYDTDEIYLQVKFDNPTGYTINSITVDDGYDAFNYENEQITVIDKDAVRFKLNTQKSIYTLKSYTYSNTSVGTKTKDVQNVFTLLAVLSGDKEVVEIKTAEQLKEMNGFKYYKLVNDIDLKDIPWDSPADFSGVFDGDGHTIKNMRVVGATFENRAVYLGLFKSAMGLIKNLNIEDTLIIATVNNGACYYGGAAAKVEYKGLTLDNVHTSGEISITCEDSYVGGIVGDGTCCVTITDCYNTSNISGGIKAGGILGYSNGGFIIITNCYNTGNILSRYGFGAEYTGGIVGGGYNNITITNCYNIGSITGSNDYTGGIIGYGYSNIDITNCYNTGNITGGSYTGGIAGSVGGTTNITNCYNTGDISSSNYAGGILGYGYNNITITDCYNTGDISGNVWYKGGIIGYDNSNNENITITNCFYIAEGERVNFVGDGESATFTNCYHFSEGSQGIKANSLDELLSKMRELFSGDIWDFDSATDLGFPTLR